ncbi:type VI secretion system-associated FHA domain protein TagH [Cupriavidus basilensis]|uniref:Type VI secretion system-associated FHA domain protein TagH n=1 Tax=Cupriavidus basilensis TaxID=68895 RepID=A0ABT6AFT2_9BURK|nr:type VI secretion system-associated FHA domain protein TagH [Cupriavidus basilensis]MDF3831469.1 type VI secretion system-associated FHA domain protein TagH [Cupriavidus basilensis]
MNTFERSAQVALVVTNPQGLRLGSLPRHHFGPAGGIIGSIAADWVLADSRGHVQQRHCEILLEDGAFCMVDRCGHTRINDSPDPLGQDVSVRLHDGDRLLIGPFHVAVHLEEAGHTLPDPGRHLAEHSIDELLDPDRADADTLPDLPADDGAESLPESRSPLDLLRPLDQELLDPLQALDAIAAQGKTERASAPLDPRHYGMTEVPAPPDLAHTRFEAFTGSPHLSRGDHPMSSNDLTPDTASAWDTDAHPDQGGSAEAITTLLEGLGVPLGDLDGPSRHRLMQEIGLTLAAMIRGLLELYRSPLHAHERIAMQNRTLQPIEDNPFRLGQDYAQTVQALFSRQRSPVHLTAPAAVEESLTQVRRHQQAIVRGIEGGLDALLQAFDPALLIERFQRYRPDPRATAGESDWAWTMYASYYDELRSERQRGFDKLFWEVFAQHYDRALRTEPR